jgi:DNA-binding NarL/FixJ family response regulator
MESMKKVSGAYKEGQNSAIKSNQVEGDQFGSIKWVFNPVIHLDLNTESGGDLLNSKNVLLAALNSIQDGVSILDTNLHVRYVNTTMKYWYSISRDFVGEKCYRVYHNRNKPCDNCPILNTISKKAPHIGIMKYSQAGKDRGWQQLFAIPIMDVNENIVGVLEHVRDISYQYQLEHDLNMIIEKYQSLERRSTAISDLLAQRKLERKQLEETIAQNVEKFIRPSLNYLKARSDGIEVNLVETLIEEIVYPITKNRSSILEKLTTRELQVATLIKEGKTSSEIAKTLVVSNKTVDFHRANIRKKLDMQTETGKRTNLRTYLVSHL